MSERLGTGALILCLLALPASGSPRRGSEPAGPQPVRGRAVALQGLAGGSVPLAFPATHIAWRWRGPDEPSIRFRAVLSDGLGPWHSVAEAHDLEADGRHHSGVVAVGQAVAVDWKIPLGGPPPRGLTVDYIDAGTSPVSSESLQGAAQPRIVTRAEWGADESIKRTSGDCRRRFWPVQQLFVHHTAGANFDRDPAATMRAIYWYHTVRRGWCDIGYNFVVGWDGTIFEGRWARPYGHWEVHSSEARNGDAVAGAHVADFNAGSVGVAAMGNFTSMQAPPEIRQSLAELLAWETDRHDLDPQGRHTYRNPVTGETRRLPVIAGHRDAGQTSCPGTTLYRSLRGVRRDTAAAMGAGKASTSVTLTGASSFVYPGDPATLTGTVSGPDGAPLVFTTVRIYKRIGRGAWVDGGEVTTDADGTFSFTDNPAARLQVVAFYPGDERLWGAQSDVVVTKVRPRVALVPQGGYDDGSGTWHYPAGTSVVQLYGNVDPAHPGASIVMRLRRVEADGSSTLWRRETIEAFGDGSFMFELGIPEPGVRYRVTARFQRDKDHAGSSSDPVVIMVDA